MQLKALSWNLFHGRDFPPNPTLLTWRSRLLRITERDGADAQVNRDLRDEFIEILAGAEWDVALLQEAPPRWISALATATHAAAHEVLTSRNSLRRLRARAAQLNPDLVASAEGGSNLTLVRGRILERRELELTPGPEPERRAMAFTRAVPDATGIELCVANLHASAGAARRSQAESEVLLAADRATAWAGGAPLILGGDLNLRPAESSVYEKLDHVYDLRAPTSQRSLDHLLVRGLAIAEPATAWPLARRQVREGGRAITLSDHAPVAGGFLPPGGASDTCPSRT